MTSVVVFLNSDAIQTNGNQEMNKTYNSFIRKCSNSQAALGDVFLKWIVPLVPYNKMHKAQFKTEVIRKMAPFHPYK